MKKECKKLQMTLKRKVVKKFGKLYTNIQTLKQTGDKNRKEP